MFISNHSGFALAICDRTLDLSLLTRNQPVQQPPAQTQTQTLLPIAYSLVPKASSLKPQASSLFPSSLKPQASSLVSKA